MDTDSHRPLSSTLWSTSISNTLMILKQKSQLLQFINLNCWTLAGGLFLPLLLFGLGAKANYGWGIWLYIGLAIVMAFIEAMFMKQTTGVN